MTNRDAYIAKMKLQLDELKAAGEDSWENLVAGTEKVRDAFTHSFHYFKSQL